MQSVKHRSPWSKAQSIAKISHYTQQEIRALDRIQAKDTAELRIKQGEVASRWAKKIMTALPLKLNVCGAVPSPEQRSSLWVGNHSGYLDIPLLLSIMPMIFVAKKEVRRWPVFGSAAEKVGTLFVDRSQSDSRKAIVASIAEHIVKRGSRVSLFPEGTSSIEGLSWRLGSFRLAHEHKFLVQPFALTYTPFRPCAFVNDDNLVEHLWKMLNHTLEATIDFHEPVMIEDPEKDASRLEAWVLKKHRSRLAEQGYALAQQDYEVDDLGV